MTLSILDAARVGIIDPTTGEVIDPKNVDQLAEAYAKIDALAREYGEALRAIRTALGELSEGDARTRRVRGEHHRVKLEMQPPNWNQKKLREAWDGFPKLAEEFIRIERFAPKLREVKKLDSESGNESFEIFKALILSAEEPSTSPPRVVLETDSEAEKSEQEWRLRAALKASLETEE